MILKYIVPEKEQNRYDGLKTIYCEIEQKQRLIGSRSNLYCYKVKMINFRNLSNIFLETELQKLNILDKIKLKLNK